MVLKNETHRGEELGDTAELESLFFCCLFIFKYHNVEVSGTEVKLFWKKEVHEELGQQQDAQIVGDLPFRRGQRLTCEMVCFFVY